MPNKNRNRNNVGKQNTMIPVKRIREKKETILIEIAKNEVIGEFVAGFEVIKPVKRYGKYYVLAKNK